MDEWVVWSVLVGLFLAAFFLGCHFWKVARRLIARQVEAFWEKKLSMDNQEHFGQQNSAQGKRTLGLGTPESAIIQQFRGELANINRRLAALEQKQGGLTPVDLGVLREAVQAATLTEVAPGLDLAPKAEPALESGPLPPPAISDPDRDRFLAHLENLKRYFETKGESGQQFYQDLQERGFGSSNADKVDFINRLFELASVGELRDKSLKYKCEQLFDIEVEYPPLGDSIPPLMNKYITSNYRQSLSQAKIYHKIEEFWQNKEIGAGRVCYVIRPIVKERKTTIPLQDGAVVLY